MIGGSGNGEQIAANKVKGIRAALAWSEETASLAREHNDAWVVAVGGRMHSLDEMTRLVEVFLATPFPGDERHVRRIGQLTSYEATGELPRCLPRRCRPPAGRPTMPEGHTLHRLARQPSDVFGGQQVRVGSPQGRFADAAAQLTARAPGRRDLGQAPLTSTSAPAV